MRAAVVGAGVVGWRVADVLVSDPSVESVTVLTGDVAALAARPTAADDKLRVLRGSPGEKVPADVVVVATPSGVARAARAALEAGSHLVCPVDDPAQVRLLLGLDEEARRRGVTVAVGTAMAPGLSCLLAAHMKSWFEHVEEVHVASAGTGGPACARRHHAALTGMAVDWSDGVWRRRPGGSGRELVWFPEPVGGADCYRAALSDPLLLRPAFPDARRITSRMEATRRDRLTSWLPMMRSPHPEGLVGALRVEARGVSAGAAVTRVLGASVAPALAAAVVSSTAARWAASGRLARAGAGGLAELAGDPAAFLRDVVGLGVSVSAFEGEAAQSSPGSRPSSDL